MFADELNNDFYVLFFLNEKKKKNEIASLFFPTFLKRK
jgi:hypothetical protein